MGNFHEIDFHQVGSTKSGDAITLRYQINDIATIHIVDGGYQDTGDALTKHIQTHYDNPVRIDHVVVTHNDGDHAGGLRRILENFEVGELWMLRPWLYAEELLPRFSRYTNADNLKKRLKEIYSNLATLEELANEKGVPIRESFQGTKIGAFTVVAPSRERYLNLVVSSEKTPDATTEALELNAGLFKAAFIEAVSYIRALWGDESFSNEATSAENEMSIVQYAYLNNKKILLTGDAGRDGLAEAKDYAPMIGLVLPSIDIFQVPHHGSRRNLSSELLDQLVGEKLGQPVKEGESKFTAIISASKEDAHHPRKAVIRAMKHRGAKVLTTEENNGWTRFSAGDAPTRSNMQPAKDVPYPEDQEE